MHRESCISLVSLCLPISSAYVGGIRQFIVQITRIYATLMGYWITGQVRTMMRSLMRNSNLRIGERILSRVLMIPCSVFLRSHLRSASSIAMIGSGRGRVDGLGDAL